MKPKINARRIATVRGNLTVANGTYGFISDCGTSDVFVPASDINGAIDGDRVEAVITDAAPVNGKGRTGRIVRILDRKRTHCTAEILNAHTALPMNKRLPGHITLRNGCGKAHRGDYVRVELLDARAKNGDLCGRVTEVIGPARTVSADLDAIISEYDLHAPYTPNENKRAAALQIEPIQREDLTAVFCCAIDPHDAKDHDDAVSIAPGKEKNTVILGVHIAEVAGFIRPGSYWDKQAHERAMTAYLPGRTLPMLPKLLTDKVSLKPGQKSPAHSIMFTIDSRTGVVLSARRTHCFVRLAFQWNYDQMQAYMEGDKTALGYVPRKSVNSLIKITRMLRQNRLKDEAFLDFPLPEVRVVVDEKNGHVDAVEVRQLREAEQLVEECMLLANSQVAVCLFEKYKAAAIYRVHNSPSEERLLAFSQLMLGSFGLKVGDLSTREGCNDFIASLPDNEDKTTILQHFLRAMARAAYDEEKAPHFGLGKQNYLHFTSPIRRYTDLLVHRQLWAIDGVGKLLSARAMGELAQYCTEMEQKIDEASFAANDRMKLHYLQQQLEQGESCYDARIVRMSATAISIEIAALGLYGTLHLTAPEQKKTIRIGLLCKVELEHIDFLKGAATFILLRDSAPTPLKRKKRKK